MEENAGRWRCQKMMSSKEKVESLLLEWQEASAFLGQGFCLILRLKPTFTSGIPASYQPGTMQNPQANSQPAGISPFLVPPSLQDWNLSDTEDLWAPRAADCITIIRLTIDSHVPPFVKSAQLIKTCWLFSGNSSLSPSHYSNFIESGFTEPVFPTYSPAPISLFKILVWKLMDYNIYLLGK